jgi:CDP-6-deoxy-D-xylo-4-hexulose-3-dehydrase
MKEIDAFLDSFENIPTYTYNKNFVPGESTVYYSGPYWNKDELSAGIESLLFGSWLSSGEKVREFEEAFSAKFNQKHSVMVNSGSSANLVLIKACKKRFGWKDGDEILVSPVGFPTTISPIIESNLVPKFVDVEMKSLNFDLDLLESKITDKTVAIFLSPVLGNPCDVDSLIDICDSHLIKLLLDNCDSLGTKYKNIYLNEYAVASSHSFFPAHHISTGEGGMLSTNDPVINHIARSISWWGRSCTCSGKENLLRNGICKNRFNTWLEDCDIVMDHKYIFSNIGYNLRPLDLQGAIGLVQLKKFDEIHEKRRENKKAIQAIFRSLHGLSIEEEKDSEVSWFGMPFICDSKETKERLVKHLEENKVQTRNVFAGNLLRHPAYSYLDDWKKYPNANVVMETTFFVGVSPQYTKEMIDYIETVVEKFS